MLKARYKARWLNKEQTRLALCGSSDVALKAFLERHPEVKTINLRLDNDEAGKLVLPPKAEGKYDRVFAYLAETRGISPAVISDFMKSKQIYQDTKGNCVFVGYDEKGTAKFGAVRTTLTERKYRGDCKNSDKRYAFSQIGTDSTRLYIFEAPIDLLSHCTITINNLRNYPKIYRYALWLYICIFQYWYMFFKRLSCGQ